MADFRRRIWQYSIRQDQINNTIRHRRRTYLHELERQRQLEYDLLEHEIQELEESERNLRELECQLDNLWLAGTPFGLIENPFSDTCPICLNEYEFTDNVRVLQCNHIYCHDCILKWLTVVYSCPVCKSEP